MRRLVLALAIWLAGIAGAQAAATYSGLPAASQPLGNIPDAVPMDQGLGCFTKGACLSVQTPSLRLGQPIQATCASVTSPFPFQQCIDTSVTPNILKMYLGTTWAPIATLDTTTGVWTLIAPTNAAGGVGVVANTAALRNACTGLGACPAGGLSFPNGVLRWTDGVANAPPLGFTRNSGACVTDDGATCVNSADGNHWNGEPANGVWDVREWGAALEGTPGYSGNPPVDPAGTFDSTAALNAACAANVPLAAPAGRFHVTNMISCPVQIIGGAGSTTLQTVIDVGSDFNMSAAGVINVAPSSASNQMGAQLHNLDIEFYQNSANFPTITATVNVTSLTLVSGSLAVGQGVGFGFCPPGDYVASGTSPNFTLAVSCPGPSHSNATGTVFNTFVGTLVGTALTTSGGSPAIGDVIAGPGIPNGTTILTGSGTNWTVSQSPTATVSGETISYYALIQYPWAITATTPPARPILDNVTVARAWNGIEFPGNYAPIFKGITQIGAFNIPLLIDGSLDYVFAHSIEVWPFGNAAVPGLSGVWYMNPPNVEIGYIDGFEVANFGLFSANMTFLSDAQYVTGYQFGNLHFNGTYGGIYLNAGGVMVSNLSLDMSGPGITVDGPFDSTFLHVSMCKCITSAPANYIVNHQGRLEIDGGVFSFGGTLTGPLIAVDTAGGGSTTIIRGMDWHMPTPLSQSVVSQTGSASLVLDGLTTVKGGTDSAPLVNIATDLGSNYLSHLNFGNWGTSTVAITLSGTGVKGYYDLPGVDFAITATPTFVTEGDFAPANVTTTGYYKLRGDRVDYAADTTFDTNAYTTAAGGFFLATNLPVSGVDVGGLGSPPAILSRISNVTINAGWYPAALISLTNPPEIFPIQNKSAVTWSEMGPGNFPASTTGIELSISGSYLVH